jgi:hypothetical protein
MSVGPFEHHRAPLAPGPVFYSRVARSAVVALTLIAGTLVIGTAGYHWIGDLAWIGAFHQAAMLLSGMGPVASVSGTPAILFDSFYALFCGVMLLAAAAVMFAPIVHRLMHRFHLEGPRER